MAVNCPQQEARGTTHRPVLGRGRSRLEAGGLTCPLRGLGHNHCPPEGLLVYKEFEGNGPRTLPRMDPGEHVLRSIPHPVGYDLTSWTSSAVTVGGMGLRALYIVPSKPSGVRQTRARAEPALQQWALGQLTCPSAGSPVECSVGHSTCSKG